MKKTLIMLALAILALVGLFVYQTQISVTKVAIKQEQRNKKNALAFYEMVFNEHKVKEGTDKYVADTYIQHNPTVADGPKAFIDTFAPFVKENPNSSAEVKRVAAEGDLVFLHVHSRLNQEDKGEAVVDVFRFDKNGKIVEHWDVIQTVPDQTESGHSMF